MALKRCTYPQPPCGDTTSAGDTACRREQGYTVSLQAVQAIVSSAEAGPGADLDGSSNYSNEKVLL